MGTKKKQETPAVKTWIWLKSAKSKALKELCDTFGAKEVRKICGRWLECSGPDSDGDFRMANPDPTSYILPREVAHVVESVECPKDPPTKAAKIDRVKHPKASSKVKATWTPIPHPEIGIRTTKRQILRSLQEILDRANQLGAENAKLKNQIAKLKGAK